MKPPFLQRLVIWLFKAINSLIPWHKLPTPLAVFNLLALRFELQAKNLHDTYPSPDSQGDPHADRMPDTKFLCARNSDGKFNDLQRPRMGCAGMRFGRNVPRAHTRAPNYTELMTPNPRTVSERLLARPDGGFKPATIVNLLAAAWIQFQVHDWAQHFDSHKTWEVPLAGGDKWSDQDMKINRTQRDAPLDAQDYECPAYQNKNSAGALPYHKSKCPLTRDQHTGGTPVSCTARTKPPHPHCATARRTASSRLTARTARTSSRAARTASRSRASTTTGGWAWSCCTRCSRSSTTPSATRWPWRTQPGPRTSSSTRLASSTAR